MADTVPVKDVDALPGQSPSYAPGEAIPPDMPQADKTTKGLADIQKQKMDATGKLYDDLSKKIDVGVAKVEEAQKHAGVEPGVLKPWDEAAESKKRQTDPIEAFGSLGSAFGILASAFTHRPFVNALNASAAAINAIKAGNADDYDRAYKAWQDNQKLALEKHKIQHEQYQDAITLLNTNLAAGEAKMRVLAAKYGDEKTMFLLNQGLDKEVIELQEARQKLATDLALNQPKIALENAKMSRLFALGYDPKQPQSEKSQKALKQFSAEYGPSKTADQQFSQQWHEEHPDGTADEFSKAYGEFKRGQYGHPLSAEQEFVQRWHQEHPNATIDEFTAAAEAFKRNSKGSSSTDVTIDRQIAADTKSIMDKYKKEHSGATPEELADVRATTARKLRAEAAAPTGNRVDDLKGKVNQVKIAQGIIEHIDEMMLRHKAITGIGGTLTRPMEVVGNILGSNETDRKQFQRWVQELQEIAPRILLDTKGRPLSSEAGRINGIIAGLQPGDTSANTIRAYVEFKKVLKDIEGNLHGRIEGDATEKPAAKEPDGDWWKSPAAGPVVH